jgi:hypothetical protein
MSMDIARTPAACARAVPRRFADLRARVDVLRGGFSVRGASAMCCHSGELSSLQRTSRRDAAAAVSWTT